MSFCEVILLEAVVQVAVGPMPYRVSASDLFLPRVARLGARRRHLPRKTPALQTEPGQPVSLRNGRRRSTFTEAITDSGGSSAPPSPHRRLVVDIDRARDDQH